jgi:hypothetical protein
MQIFYDLLKYSIRYLTSVNLGTKFEFSEAHSENGSISVP